MWGTVRGMMGRGGRDAAVGKARVRSASGRDGHRVRWGSVGPKAGGARLCEDFGGARASRSAADDGDADWAVDGGHGGAYGRMVRR